MEEINPPSRPTPYPLSGPQLSNSFYDITHDMYDTIPQPTQHQVVKIALLMKKWIGNWYLIVNNTLTHTLHRPLLRLMGDSSTATLPNKRQRFGENVIMEYSVVVL